MNNPTETTRPGRGMTPCPCCGQVTEAKLPLLDRGSGKVSFGSFEAHLPRSSANLLELLLRRYPNTVRYSPLIEHLWERDEPDGAEQTLKVHICQLRKVLKPMGFGIAVNYKVGYRLERLS